LGHHGWSMAVHSPPWEQQCWLYPPYGPLLPSSPSHISCHSDTPQFLISTMTSNRLHKTCNLTFPSTLFLVFCRVPVIGCRC
jgi:hypothetical protein